MGSVLDRRLPNLIKQNAKFIKTVTSALKIDQSLMKVTQLRSGSVYVTFTVDIDGSISLNSLTN